MKKLTAPDATAAPGTKAPRVKVKPVRSNPPKPARGGLRPRGWIS